MQVVGFDFSGHVTAVGPNEAATHKFGVGDEVFSLSCWRFFLSPGSFPRES